MLNNLLGKTLSKAEISPLTPADTDYQTSIAWPEEWFKGAIKTKNATGIMVTDLGPAEKEFIALAETAKQPLMDIGCAYGVATRPAIANGARDQGR